MERRELHFETILEALEEAQRLASKKFRTTGNHSFGQILNHLALSLDVSSGRVEPPPMPWLMKLMMPLIKRTAINSKPMKPGIVLPAKNEIFFWPRRPIKVQAGLHALNEATKYYQKQGPLEVHPYFGKVTKEQSDQLNCRHAALHLSFVHRA